MRKLLLLSWIILFSTQVYAKTCVLSFFVKDSDEANMVKKVYQYYKSANLKENASLNDARACLSHGYEEVIWLSHGSSFLNGSVPIYYRNENGKDIPTPILARFMQTLSEDARKNNQLQKFRIAMCGANTTNSISTQNLLNTLSTKKIEVDIAPEFELGSFLLGISVTQLSKEWLSRSIDRWSLLNWRTESNRYCEKDYWNGCDRNLATTVYPGDVQ